MSKADDAKLDKEALGFIFDDISADERPEGIIGGCLLNDAEDKCYRAFLRSLRYAVAAGSRMNSGVRGASTRLLALMETSGVPQYAA